MKNTLTDAVFTLYFEGELNSYNADNIEKDILATIGKQSFKSLVLDFSNLSYISSAGLRVILKLKQKYNDVSIVEASLEVYDVLSMTGFTNMMNIKKALKRVYVDGSEVIGQGFFSTVYRINKDTIIKVFNRVSDPDQIERELSLAKQAFILGIPTAISFDIVRVNDKLGVRFEMLDCESLKAEFLNHPENFDTLIKKYVDLLKKINTTVSEDPNIPHIKDLYYKKLDLIKEHLDEKHWQKAYDLVKNIPDRETFVHGDCHFKNIMVQQDELLLIDMDTLSKGHPIFELSAIYCSYIAFEEDDPGNNERFLGIPKELAQRIYAGIIDNYFKKVTDDIKNKLRIVAYIHMMWWNRVNEPQNNVRFEGCRNRLIELLDKYDDLDIGI